MYINTVMVSDWHRFYPSVINTKLESWSTSVSWNIYFSYKCLLENVVGAYVEETCYSRLYYDLLYWYLFVFWISLISYTIHKIPSLKLFIRKRVLLNINLPYGFRLKSHFFVYTIINERKSAI